LGVCVVVFAVGSVLSMFLLVALGGLSSTESLPLLALYSVLLGATAFGMSFASTYLATRLFPREVRLGLRSPLVASLGCASALTVLFLIVLVAL
jgi:hypothetical protein